MASVKYLWRNRSKHKFLTMAYFKAWVKRIYNLKELFLRNKRRSNLVKKGATITETAEIGVVNFTGNKKHLKIGAFFLHW